VLQPVDATFSAVASKPESISLPGQITPRLNEADLDLAIAGPLADVLLFSLAPARALGVRRAPRADHDRANEERSRPGRRLHPETLVLGHARGCMLPSWHNRARILC
jgi:hypothetical protein